MAFSSAPSTLRERAYRHILTKILSGEVGAGGMLSELSLSKEIGISRTPVREAMGQLATEGFLEQVPGRGALVRQPSRMDLLELYELREALEVYAVGKVARHGLPAAAAENLSALCDDLVTLTAGLEARGGAILEAAEMKRFLALDLHFHNLLLRTSGNQRLTKVVRDTRLLLQIFGLPRRGHDLAQLRQIHVFHSGILEAVRNGDAATGIRLTTEHINLSKAERLDAYDQWERARSLPPDDFLTPYFGIPVDTRYTG